MSRRWMVRFPNWLKTWAHQSILALALATISSTGLTACSAPWSSGASASALTIWYATDDPYESKWATGLVPLFMHTHPGVSVTMRAFDFSEMDAKMPQALASGTGPDLAYASPRAPEIPVYVSKSKLMDLTAASTKNNWPALLRPGLLTDYNAPFGLYCTKAPSRQRAVKVFGVPDAIAAAGILYNKILLSRLHLTAPTTLAQFEHAGQVAKAAGITPYGFGNEDLWLGDDWYDTLVNSKYSHGYLSSVLRLNPRFSFQKPYFLKAAELMIKWKNDGYFPSGFQSMDAQTGVDAFFRGHTLFQLASSSQTAQVLHDQAETHIPIGVTAFPATDGSHHGVMASSGFEGWVVPKSSKHSALAIEWINFMLHRKGVAFVMKHGVLPATRADRSLASSALQRGFIQAYDRAKAGVYLDSAPVGNLNGTMEENIQILLAGVGQPSALTRILQQVYDARATQNCDSVPNEPEI